jgi:hypothetical protein
VTSAESIARAAALTDGYGLPEDALELLRNEISWALDLSEARGRDAERAAVVAWLRKHWSEVLEQTPQQTAKLIERGEHRREEEK